MKLRIDHENGYIRAIVENNYEKAVLRCWPWPHNERGRQMNLKEAHDYVKRISGVLLCPVEIQ